VRARCVWRLCISLAHSFGVESFDNVKHWMSETDRCARYGGGWVAAVGAAVVVVFVIMVMTTMNFLVSSRILPSPSPSSCSRLPPPPSLSDKKVIKMLIGNKCDLTTKKVVDYTTAQVRQWQRQPHAPFTHLTLFPARNSPIPSRSPSLKPRQRTPHLSNR